MTDSKKDQLAITILILLYAVGTVMLSLDAIPGFVRLTPFNLLLSLALVLWRHPGKDQKLWVFAGVCYFIGLIAEMVGVQTGLIFGTYYYGEALGPKILETPLIIGVNWILLVYASGVAVNHFAPGLSFWLRSLMAAAIMVLLDVLIEPVAVALGFWSWEDGLIPLQNYVAWYVLSFALLLLFYRLLGNTVNKVAVVLLVLQFLFFGILNGAL